MTRRPSSMAVGALLLALSATTEGGAQRRVETAVFAGGCFWCVEADFDKVMGVVSTTSGYTGGSLANPTYQQVSSGGTGHVEAVRVEFDPSVVTYDVLLEHFWKSVDPFNGRGQFCDTGEPYRPVIFVSSADQRKLAEASRQAVQARFKERIAVDIEAAGPFYAAEAYHQDYYLKNPVRYRFYRWNCGRDSRLAQVWGGT
jgi:peptide-methionine (S)-S-oxide reductase